MPVWTGPPSNPPLSENCDCDPFFIASSTPPDGTVDPLQDFSLLGLTPQGFDEVEVTFNCRPVDPLTGDPPTVDNFWLESTGGVEPLIVSVTPDGDSNTIFNVLFSDPIPSGEWTTLYTDVVGPTGVPLSEDADSVTLGLLPADVDRSGRSTATDVLYMIDLLNGRVGELSNLALCDIDRSGLCVAADVLRIIDLFNGVSTTRPWINVSLPPRPCDVDADCADPNLCTEDVCDFGECRHYSGLCGDQLCDPATGQCVDCRADIYCDDGRFCSGVETCVEGACQPGDGNPCVDDGLFCNGFEVCDEGKDSCRSTGDPCDVDVCNEETDACDPKPECEIDTDCDDDDLCTVDTCTEGACDNIPVDCGDQICNPDSGLCVECNDNADCDDGFLCTVDVCNRDTNQCEKTNIDLICDDGLFCSGAWTCDPIDPSADHHGCVSTGNPCSNPTPVCDEEADGCDGCSLDAECDDGIPCTTDFCLGGSCNNIPDDFNCPDPLNCDGRDFCAFTHPNADEDGCVRPGNPCDPKLCEESMFVPGDPETCTDCTSNADCDDGITCTQDLCNGATGDCSHSYSNDLCPDELFCDGLAFCAPLHPYADSDGCVNDLPNYTCFNACDEDTDTCFDCASNIECDDGIDCTDDLCNGVTGECVHVDNCGFQVCNYQTGHCE